MTGRKQKCGYHVEGFFETDRSWRTNVILDNVYLGCTESECKPNAAVIDEYRKMFESRISAGATE